MWIFGNVVDIRRIGRDARCVPRYATKCLRFVSRELRTQANWPKRRWSASRAARAQMNRAERSPDWYWSPFEPPTFENETRKQGFPDTKRQRSHHPSAFRLPIYLFSPFSFPSWWKSEPPALFPALLTPMPARIPVFIFIWPNLLAEHQTDPSRFVNSTSTKRRDALSF